MKKLFRTAFILIGAMPFALFGQGTFQNLNFESANLPVLPAGQNDYVDISAAMPGWTVYYGGQQPTHVVYNAVSTGAASANILGPNFGGTIIDGSYSVMLQAGADSAMQLVSTSIAQSGTLPQNAQFLQFKAWGTSDFSVSFGGQNLSLASLSSGPNYTLYSADISAFSGSSGELMFTVPTNPNALVLDSIAFVAVPEPTTYALCLFGLAGLWFCRKNCNV